MGGHSEYVGAKVFAMTGTSVERNAIVANIVGGLGTQTETATPTAPAPAGHTAFGAHTWVGRAPRASDQTLASPPNRLTQKVRIRAPHRLSTGPTTAPVEKPWRHSPATRLALP